MRRPDLKAQEGRHDSMFVTNFIDHDLGPDFGYCGWDDHFFHGPPDLLQDTRFFAFMRYVNDGGFDHDRDYE